MRMGLVIGMASLALHVAVPAWAQCGWTNVPDTKVLDSRRGVLTPQAHLDYVNSEAEDTPDLIQLRMTALQRCIGQVRFADLYAKTSVRIATAGRDYAGWKD